MNHRWLSLWERLSAKRTWATFCGLALLMVFGLSAAEAAVQDYAGTYSGTYSGADTGTWSVFCDTDGAVLIFSWSNGSGQPDGGLGSITATGHIAVTTEEGTTISADVNPGGTVSGSWSVPQEGLSGKLSGRKSLPAELASFSGSYAGTFAGGDSGTWSAVIDEDGIFNGIGISNTDKQSFAFAGFVNYSGELFAVVENDAVVHATIGATGIFNGVWRDPEGESGTITGSRSSQPKKPTVTTADATGVGTGSATLNGSVNPNGSTTSYYFEYGTTTGYGMQTATTAVGSGTVGTAVSAPVNALAPGTPYHFRLVAYNTAGTTFGSDRTFLTHALLPTVSTAVPSSIDAHSAVSGGEVTSDGGGAVTARGVCWSTAADPTILDNKTTDGSGTGVFASSLTDLSPGTTYHVRAYATNSAGTAYGDDLEFATLPAAPTAVTGGAVAVTEGTAHLYGRVKPNGDDTTYFFEYGETSAYGFETPIEDVEAATAEAAVSASISGLLADTAYHYRLVAENNAGESTGNDATFSTEILYVEPSGDCGGKSPCYKTIAFAVDDAGPGATIRIAQATYDETPVLSSATKLIISGGWNDTFTASSGFTTLDGNGLPALSIEKGSLVVEGLILQ